jgi:hypothetical protein
VTNLCKLFCYYLFRKALIVFIALVQIINLNNRLQMIVIVNNDIGFNTDLDKALILEIFKF